MRTLTFVGRLRSLELLQHRQRILHWEIRQASNLSLQVVASWGSCGEIGGQQLIIPYCPAALCGIGCAWRLSWNKVCRQISAQAGRRKGCNLRIGAQPFAAVAINGRSDRGPRVSGAGGAEMYTPD